MAAKAEVTRALKIVGLFLLAFVWGRVLDERRLDERDIIGSAIAFIGVALVLFWPKTQSDGEDEPNQSSLQEIETVDLPA